MKLNFVYSEAYYTALNKHKEGRLSWAEVTRLGGIFEERFKEEIEKIPDIISKSIGVKWKQDIIDIYSVDWYGPSFSSPLTLKIRNDLVLVLIILIHELVHNIKRFSQEKIENEKLTNDITENVIKELGIEADEQLQVMRKISEVKTFGYEGNPQIK